MASPLYNLTDTWDNGAEAFSSIKMVITDTAYAAGSRMIDISTTVGGKYFRVDVDGNVSMSGYMDFAAISEPAYQEGRVWYDTVRKTLTYMTDKTDVSMNIGEEMWVPVINNTGSQIDDGTPVYISGISGGIPQITKAIADGIRIIGLVTHDIPDGETGYVTTAGRLTGPDYTSFSAGDTIYLSTTVAGEVTNVQPTYPATEIEIGIILDASNPGSILIDIEHHGGPSILEKSYTFASRSASSGEYFQAGYYKYPVTSVALTQASTTQVYGTANVSYAAHAFIVSAGDGATDGSDLVLTVNGTSITDDEVRTPADSEVVCADCLPSGAAADAYFETTKKWIGQITYTLSSTAGTAFNFTFNYGYAKYDDFGNNQFTLRGVESVGLCNVTDTGFNIEVLHHKSTGWVYHATAFQAGAPALKNMNTIHGTENDIVAGEPIAFKLVPLATVIDGNASEGVIVRITTTSNNAVSSMDTHIGVTLE